MEELLRQTRDISIMFTLYILHMSYNTYNMLYLMHCGEIG